jgi:hypothetical protein
MRSNPSFLLIYQNLAWVNLSYTVGLCLFVLLLVTNAFIGRSGTIIQWVRLARGWGSPGLQKVDCQLRFLQLSFLPDNVSGFFASTLALPAGFSVAFSYAIDSFFVDDKV